MHGVGKGHTSVHICFTRVVSETTEPISSLVSGILHTLHLARVGHALIFHSIFIISCYEQEH